MLLCGAGCCLWTCGFLGVGPGHEAGLLGALTCGSVHRPDAQLWLSTINSARNSLMTHSNIEFASLELQRFWGISKDDRDNLRAKFGWRWCRRRPLRPSAPRASIGASARCPARPRRPRAPRPACPRSPTFRSLRRRGQALRPLPRPPRRRWWGFCSIRSWVSACRRCVGASCRAIPPFGGSPSVAVVGVVPKVQTTSAKTGENGLLWARWSTFWA